MSPKRFFFLLIFAFAAGLSARNLEISLYDEIKSAYNSGLYAEVLLKTQELESSFPNSVFLHEISVMKSDSLVRLGRYKDAIGPLKESISLLHSGAEDYGRCYFILGQAYFYLGDYDNALYAFSRTCVEASKTGNPDYYYQGVLFAARTYYQQNDFGQAQKFFEFVLENGGRYTSEDFVDAAEKLCGAYEQQKKHKAVLNLFETLEKSGIESVRLTRFAADAYVAEKQNQKAEELYATKITDGDKALEFWTSSGIDAFKKGDYAAAASHFEKARNVRNADSQKYALLIDYYGLLLATEENGWSQEPWAEFEPKVKKSRNPALTQSFYSHYLLCKAQFSQWPDMHRLYAELKTPSVQDTYLDALAFFREGRFDKAVSALEPFAEGTSWQSYPDAVLLYANALSKKGDFKKSRRSYKKLYDAQLLSASGRLEYAKVLFTDGLYSEAFRQASSVSTEEGRYVAGLSAVNLADWAGAEKFLARIDDENAVFYYNYALYMQGGYAAAYSGFKALSEQSDSAVTVRKSCLYAARSAVQKGDFDSAAQQAERLIQLSVRDEEVQEAVLFCAEIYSDAGEYEKVLNHLSPHTKEKSDFAARSLFMTARTYAKMGEVSAAASAYIKVYSDFPKNVLAEEAMYRSGEVQYLAGAYAAAEPRFSGYVYAYPQGTWYDAALYFAADCHLKAGDTEKAIMMSRMLVAHYDDSSVYLYGAYRTLLDAYYAEENYTAALDCAREMTRLFGEQTAADSIAEKIMQLEQITGGTDRRIVEKRSEYEVLGEAATREGRIVGTELVLLYTNSPETRQQGYELAAEILPKQRIPSEAEFAAKNAEILAQQQRENGNYTEAAGLFLKAAEYYRTGSAASEPNAALCLYNATEAFAAAGFKGDAQETAALLQSLYPKSKYAREAGRLIK